VAFAQVGWRFYILFIVLTSLGALSVWKFSPETMLLSLEEISGFFGDDIVLDIRNLSPEAREAPDREMAAIRSPSDELIRRASEASISPHGKEKTITESRLKKV